MMDLPAEVRVHNSLVGMKGTRATLLTVSNGYYELKARFGDRLHRVLLPIAGTAVISQDEEEEYEAPEDEIER